MDAIRTLLLARTHVVVLDQDRVASAATRPTRSADVDKFEAELAQLGFVMSLDLAITIRRLPHQAIQELRNWMIDTLAKTLGAHRPHVPLFKSFPAGIPKDTGELYLRRILSWLLTAPDQPCPWCARIKTVGALDPCGHLVCRECWRGGNYAGCPICHRRVAINDPFVAAPASPGPLSERVLRHDGQLRLLHLAFDLHGTAKQRFERLLMRATPLSPEDRSEVEAVIDALGPRAAMWLPAKIAVKESMAIAVARLWIVAPDREAMMRATADHLRTATDVLRVAVVLMGGNAGLDEPFELRSLSRALRKVVLAAIDRIPAASLLEDMRRHAGLWKRVGDLLHPFEYAKRWPTCALAFALVRRTDVSALSFGPLLRAQVDQLGAARIEHDRVHVTSWAGAIEDALRSGDVRAVTERLAQRPGELLRRADHLVRVAQTQPAAEMAAVLDAIRAAIPRGAPAMLLTVAGHVAQRTAAWPRRVFFPKANVLRAWGRPDTRPPLRADAIGAIVDAVRAELVARAAKRRHFARAVIDRGLIDLLTPIGERSASKSRIAWTRGSELAIPDGDTLRLFLHWEEPPGTRVDLDLSLALYDDAWRQVGLCDYTSLTVPHSVEDPAAVHSGDLTSGPAPLGASEFVDLDLPRLAALGARHAVMVVFSYNAVEFEQLTHGFAGLMLSPAAGQHFDPRAVVQRFDLGGTSVITVPLTIELATRRLRWLDVGIKGRGAVHAAGGYRAALAHIGKDFADLTASRARPTLWEVACIHAAARANIVYVRDRDGSIAQYRRRDGESTVARMGRLLAGAHDGVLATVPTVNAPTWFALMRDDFAIAAGSEGYLLDARTSGGGGLTRFTAADLVAQLAPAS